MNDDDDDDDDPMHCWRAPDGLCYDVQSGEVCYCCGPVIW